VEEKLAESLLQIMEKDGMWEMACGISGSNAGEPPSSEN